MEKYHVEKEYDLGLTLTESQVDSAYIEIVDNFRIEDGRLKLKKIFKTLTLYFILSLIFNIYLGEEILPQIIFLIGHIVCFNFLYNAGIKFFLYVNITFAFVFVFSNLFYLISYIRNGFKIPFTLIINIIPLCVTIFCIIMSVVWLKNIIFDKNIHYYVNNIYKKFIS